MQRQKPAANLPSPCDKRLPVLHSDRAKLFMPVAVLRPYRHRHRAAGRSTDSDLQPSQLGLHTVESDIRCTQRRQRASWRCWRRLLLLQAQ